MTFDFETKQVLIPDRGYSAPIGTKAECKNPAFADHHLHRVGVFYGDFDANGLPGHHLIFKCVNCGRVLPKSMFLPSHKDLII